MPLDEILHLSKKERNKEKEKKRRKKLPVEHARSVYEKSNFRLLLVHLEKVCASSSYF